MRKLDSFLNLFRPRRSATEWFLEGESLLRQSDKWDQALKCFKESIELDPADTKAWIGKGRCHKLLGQPEDALRSFDHVVLCLDPKSKDAWNFKAQVLRDEKKSEEALSCLNLALQNIGEHWDLLLTKSQVLRQLGNVSEALEISRSAIQLLPPNSWTWSAEVYTERGLCERQLGLLDEAVLSFRLAIYFKADWQLGRDILKEMGRNVPFWVVPSPVEGVFSRLDLRCEPIVNIGDYVSAPKILAIIKVSPKTGQDSPPEYDETGLIINQHPECDECGLIINRVIIECNGKLVNVLVNEGEHVRWLQPIFFVEMVICKSEGTPTFEEMAFLNTSKW